MYCNYNSAINHLELALNSTGLRLHPPQDCPYFRHQLHSGVLRPPTFWPIGCEFEDSHNTVRFDNPLQWLTELRKVLYLQLLIRNSQIERYRMRWGRRGGEMQSFCALSLWNPGVLFPTHHCVHQPGSSTELQCPKFYWGFVTQTWLIKALPRGWALSPVPTPSLEVRLAPNPNLKLQGWSFWPVPILKLSRNPPWATSSA